MVGEDLRCEKSQIFEVMAMDEDRDNTSWFYLCAWRSIIIRIGDFSLRGEVEGDDTILH